MEYKLLKANPLKESSREFLAWLSDLPKIHSGQYKMVTTSSYRSIRCCEFEAPAEFLGTELEKIK
jgi:hypothetical protein